MPPAPATAVRYDYLDVLRGFALIGVAVQNLIDGGWVNGRDAELMFVSGVFIAGKFRTLFAFLFGIGFALQFERRRQAGFFSYYVRRQSILLLIGFAHFVLLWGQQDILMPYAIAGMMLMLFARVDDRGVWLAIAFTALIALWQGEIETALMHAGVVSASGSPPSGRAVIYASGSYFDTVSYRFQSFLALHSSVSRTILRYTVQHVAVFCMFLCGMMAARYSVFDTAMLARHAVRTAVLAALVAIALIVGGVTTGSVVLEFMTTPILSLTYASALAVLWNRRRLRRFLEPLRSVGRMPLTNYMLASLLVTIVYCGYGFGQWQKLRFRDAVVLQLLLFGVQAACSVWWLGRFPQGPVEWLWRRLLRTRAVPNAVHG